MCAKLYRPEPVFEDCAAIASVAADAAARRGLDVAIAGSAAGVESDGADPGASRRSGAAPATSFCAPDPATAVGGTKDGACTYATMGTAAGSSAAAAPTGSLEPKLGNSPAALPNAEPETPNGS